MTASKPVPLVLDEKSRDSSIHMDFTLTQCSKLHIIADPTTPLPPSPRGSSAPLLQQQPPQTQHLPCKSCWGRARGKRQRAQGIDPASKLSRSQTNSTTVQCAGKGPIYGSLLVIPSATAWYHQCKEGLKSVFTLACTVSSSFMLTFEISVPTVMCSMIQSIALCCMWLGNAWKWAVLNMIQVVNPSESRLP